MAQESSNSEVQSRIIEFFSPKKKWPPSLAIFNVFSSFNYTNISQSYLRVILENSVEFFMVFQRNHSSKFFIFNHMLHLKARSLDILQIVVDLTASIASFPLISESQVLAELNHIYLATRMDMNLIWASVIKYFWRLLRKAHMLALSLSLSLPKKNSL